MQDPFDKKTDITLKAGYGTYSGKLDWLLFDSENLKHVKKGIGSMKYQSTFDSLVAIADLILGESVDQGLSDHVFLFVDLKAKH